MAWVSPSREHRGGFPTQPARGATHTLDGIPRRRHPRSFFSHCMNHTLASVNPSCLAWAGVGCCLFSSQEGWAWRQTSSEGDLKTEGLWWGKKKKASKRLFSVSFANYEAIDSYSQSLPVWGSLITDDNFLAYSELSLTRTHTKHLHPISALTKQSFHIALSAITHLVKLCLYPASHTVMSF